MANDKANPVAIKILALSEKPRFIPKTVLKFAYRITNPTISGKKHDSNFNISDFRICLIRKCRQSKKVTTKPAKDETIKMPCVLYAGANNF